MLHRLLGVDLLQKTWIGFDEHTHHFLQLHKGRNLVRALHSSRIGFVFDLVFTAGLCELGRHRRKKSLPLSNRKLAFDHRTQELGLLSANDRRKKLPLFLSALERLGCRHLNTVADKYVEMVDEKRLANVVP